MQKEVTNLQSNEVMNNDLTRAFDVIKKLEQQYHVTIKTPFMPGSDYWAGATPHGMSGFNGVPDYYVSATTLVDAILKLEGEVERRTQADEFTSSDVRFGEPTNS